VNVVVAPAKSILSTFMPGRFLTDQPFAVGEPDANCGDAAGHDQSGTYGDGYGTCTGTSMAAPHVTALVGIIRSINPLLSADKVRRIILNSGNQAAAPTKTKELGWGLPNASKAVDAVLATNPTRLTPLFSFYSEGRKDSFYTIVPQMARAAIGGTLKPKQTALAYNSSYGNTVSGYTAFPDPIPPQVVPGGSPTVDHRPRAEVFVFTTPTNPKNASVPLVPLYRLSWKCGDPTTSGQPNICADNPSHIDVTYTADPNGVTTFESVGYKLDGIEGYIYPKTIPQPTGTVRLMRKYNAARDDHAIFPESKLAGMQALGYTTDAGSDWIGYVYPNTGVPLTAIP
jgi:serine protease